MTKQLPKLIALALTVTFTLGAGQATAQPAADRSAMEAKKQAAEEKRKQLESLRKTKAKESTQQKEERLKMERKQRDAQAALSKAQAAIGAANRRKNVKAMTYMAEAWKLDPQNRDYAFLTGQLAAGVKNDSTEFAAYAGYTVIATKLLKELGPGDSDFKSVLTSRLAQAGERLHVLRSTITSGKVQITTKPGTCEITLDGAMVGTGNGTIEAIVGQHRVHVECLGHYPIDQNLNVRAGDSNRHVLKPTPIAYFGWLQINVNPTAGVTIFLDDVPIENRKAAKASKDGKVTGTGTKKDPIRLHARKWILRFKKQGFDRWHRRITITRDSMMTVNAALETMEDNVDASGN